LDHFLQKLLTTGSIECTTKLHHFLWLTVYIVVTGDIAFCRWCAFA